MKYLSIDELIVLHDRYVEMFGGSPGIRDGQLLESAVYRCQATFGGKDLYPTLFGKAAALFHSIIFDHPFIDGNKRAALFGTDRFLFLNGYEFRASNREAAGFPLFVERTRPDISEIAKWFRKHCQKTKSKNSS